MVNALVAHNQVPTNCKMWISLGLCLGKITFYEFVIQSFVHLLEVDTLRTSVDMYINLGVNLIRIKKRSG